MENQVETKIEAYEVKDEIKRVAKSLRTKLERLGYTMARVHHSPISYSIYYKIYHATDIDYRQSEIRISDHESRNTHVMELVVANTEAKNNAAIDEFIEDYGLDEYEK